MLKFFDFMIFILGVYGLSWLLVFSIIFEPLRHLISKIKFFKDLISCIVCTSVWISIFFVSFSIEEYWYAKLLMIGTTTTTTWALANLLGDVD